MPGVVCSRCGSAATLFLGTVAGAESAVVSFCQACLPEGILKAPLPATAAGLSLAIPLPAGRTRCPSCGFRWSDFERHQRLGCPSCYVAHATQATPLVSRSQPSLTHQGRKPGAPVSPLQVEMEGLVPDARPKSRRQSVGEIESLLATAILKEDYEEAARLRDLLSARRTGG